MSETELPTGSDFTLANAGLTRAPTKSEQPEAKTYGPGQAGIEDAANTLTRERGSVRDGACRTPSRMEKRRESRSTRRPEKRTHELDARGCSEKAD